MIFAIDHIALTCSDAPSACAQASSLGYSKVFSAINVPNPLIKKTLMKDWCDNHDLFYFQKNGSFNIEVIRYDSIHEGAPYLSPYLADKFGETIVLYVQDLEAGYKFWSLLGLKLIKKGPENYWCSFRSPLSPEIPFVISQRPSKEGDNTLDTSGFNGIAFVSTAVGQDQKVLLDSGIKTTPIEDVKINGKMLSIFFAEGSSGEQIEIIGVRKG